MCVCVCVCVCVYDVCVCTCTCACVCVCVCSDAAISEHLEGSSKAVGPTSGKVSDFITVIFH